MDVNISGFISALKLRTSGDRGWRITTCIFCNAKDKFGILLQRHEDKQPHWHCWKCQRSGTLIFLANYIGRPDLVTGEYVPPMTLDMDLFTDYSKMMVVKETAPPVGFRRVKTNEYLSGRDITDWQMEMYKFGMTKLNPKLSNYITLLIEEGDKIVGYVSRIMLKKEEIDAINATRDTEIPRYVNSESEFDKLILGIDEIEVGVTKKMILVEGAYDKFAIDRKLGLNKEPLVKCGCTFGTKLSDIQAMKLASKGIESVTIMHDAGVVDKSKKVSSTASSYFKMVSIATLVDGDPDEVSTDEILQAIGSSRSVVEYSLHDLDTDKFTL